jgi:hypothetical protein
MFSADEFQARRQSAQKEQRPAGPSKRRGMTDAHRAERLHEPRRLMIEPILLGGGKQLFPGDGQARALELVSATTTGTGVLICTYRRR